MQKLGQRATHLGLGLAQKLLRAVYPSQCMTCDTLVEEEGALCPACWKETPFIFGACCDSCGVPLPGEADGAALHCDDCMALARPWVQGRAVMLYDGRARQILLALKYHDREDHALTAARWMARVAIPMLQPDMLVAPVPLHWLRLAKRRYNQSALLSRALARNLHLDHCPDLLVRPRYTGTQDGRGRAGRFANVADAFAPHPRRSQKIRDRHILLVDDVMTVGATFAAAAEACLAHGAASVRVIALARVARQE